MRYILIAKDDAAGVLKVVYHNSCQKKERKRKKEKKIDKYFFLIKQEKSSQSLLISINYSIIIIKSNKNERLTMNPKRGRYCYSWGNLLVFLNP
jgi:hypothetical protein